jgi:hypothetical protein
VDIKVSERSRWNINMKMGVIKAACVNKLSVRVQWPDAVVTLMGILVPDNIQILEQLFKFQLL